MCGEKFLEKKMLRRFYLGYNLDSLGQTVKGKKMKYDVLVAQMNCAFFRAACNAWFFMSYYMLDCHDFDFMYCAGGEL